jgi:hypothetical protein
MPWVSAHQACCIAGVLHIVQEAAEDDTSVTAQLADVFNLMRPADSGRPTLTAADWGGVSAEEMATRMKVSLVQGSGICLTAAKH